MDNHGDRSTLQLGPLGMLAVSIVIGLIGSLGAVIFRGMIALFHNLFFFGSLSIVYDANVHTPKSPLGPLIVLVPVAGAVMVAFLVKNFAPEAKGHGVPEVMDAIYYRKGFIRPIVALIKALASAISIGSGASVGREGPIIQIGSAFGSTLAQLLKVPVWQRITMIAAGAGAGIAATFNTPVGGVLFAMELLLHEVSVKTLVPVAISTATATYIGRIFFGAHPSFVIPAFEHPYFRLTNPVVLLSYTGLGVLMGLLSSLYIRSIYAFEGFFEERLPGSYYLRHMSAMLVFGVMMYLLMESSGHYYIDGVGYAAVQDILSGKMPTISLLIILCLLKLVSTSLALGSGGSGGIFSPALFMGATVGGAYGIVLHHLFPGHEITPSAFAVAGMAGVVGGTTGAAIAAIVMILEMTFDYSVVIPMTITVAFSYGIRTLLVRESIYTLKLVRRGHYMPEALHSSVHRLKRVKDSMDRRFITVPASLSVGDLLTIAGDNGDALWFLLEENGGITAIVGRERLPHLTKDHDMRARMGELFSGGFVVQGEESTLIDILTVMRREKANMALIVDRELSAEAGRVKGVVSKEMIADAMAEAFSLFSDRAR